MQHFTRQTESARQIARQRGYLAWRKRDEVERLSLPARPPDPTPGDVIHRITVESGGMAHIITACWPQGRKRSDQFAVFEDGVCVAELEGRTAILARVAGHLVRMMTRQERARAE
jgi:hypothetical protein